MPDIWSISESVRAVRLAKFLIATADDKGLTHGEKHHFLQVAGYFLNRALSHLDEHHSILERNLDSDDTRILSDIPI